MSEDTKKICPYCGSENSSKNKFCSNCGVSLQETEEIQIDYGPAEETIESDVHYETYSGDSTYYTMPAGEGVYQKTEGGNIGVAIASMVCGIISIPCCCLWMFSAILAIAAVVLGIIALSQKYDGKGLAVAGIITGGVGFILAIFFLLVMGLESLTAITLFS